MHGNSMPLNSFQMSWNPERNHKKVLRNLEGFLPWIHGKNLLHKTFLSFLQNLKRFGRIFSWIFSASRRFLTSTEPFWGDWKKTISFEYTSRNEVRTLQLNFSSRKIKFCWGERFLPLTNLLFHTFLDRNLSNSYWHQRPKILQDRNCGGVSDLREHHKHPTLGDHLWVTRTNTQFLW